MTETCKSCHDPLTLTLDPEASGDEGQTVPDDLLLPCGCHFHWQCLLDESAAVASALRCPSCTSYLSAAPTGGAGPSTFSSSFSASASSSAQPSAAPILTRYASEGGVQENFDICPTLIEEAFLTAHAEARPARALHTLAAEGDVAGMVALLSDVDSSNTDTAPPTSMSMSAAQLLAWRDPLNGLRSALHVALEAGQAEVVWLLLWLGSRAARAQFPAAVVQAAEGMGLPRPGEGQAGGLAVEVEKDVRFVRDERGRAAAEVCLELGEPWSRLVEGGLFSGGTGGPIGEGGWE